ncbi:M28 family metallopeptidase [Solibacillus silvestris]|uniref:M28 family metallopeptidase n=1 Tax=Solibacillus silvestris TaxID=76853 RepID=UPI003F822064
MKLYKIIYLFIFSILFISGCSEPEKTENNPYLTIVNHLTNEDMNGRLTGTKGNEKAVDYIKEQFAMAKLETIFNESYLHSYAHTYYNPEKQKVELSIHYENKEMKLEYGIDFLEQKSVKSLQSRLPICDQQEELIKDDCIFITTDGFPLNNPYIKGVLISKPDFYKHLPTNLNGIPIFQIQEKIYERLVTDIEDIQQIEMNMELTNEVIEAHNIVGKITGTGHGDHRDALIISAHFDSVGSIGDSSIDGAIDNASGVASLIQLAFNLKQHSLSKDFQSDIIFVAFNGEESGMQGSEAFIENIAQSYKNISNINIDSIGIKDIEEYMLVNTENGQALRERLISYLKDHQFNIIDENPSITSDHMSFSKKNYPAVTIGQNELDLIHTLKDKKDVIDTNKLHEIVTGLFNYIVEKEGIDLELIHEHSELTEEELKISKELVELANEEERNLEFGQYKRMSFKETETEVVNSIVAFNDELEFTSVSSATAKLNWLTIPDKLNEYSFNKGYISVFLAPDNFDSLETDKVYEIGHFAVEDLSSLKLIYLDSNSEGYDISIGNTQIGNDAKNKVVPYQDHEYIVSDYEPHLIISTSRQWDNKTYYYSISKVKQENNGDRFLLWTSGEVEEALQTIHSFDLENWTKQMGLK